MEDSQLLLQGLIGNRFEVQCAAGSGGMGTVYRATDHHTGNAVALKLLQPRTGSADSEERFLREAQILSQLRHPGIVSYVGHGRTADNQLFLAMEWLDGQDLGERLARGPLPVRDCLRILQQVTDALCVAHQSGIIHRDLKPTNLFLVGEGSERVKILDFGIARRDVTSRAMTKTGAVVGTPEYMAPEQARGSRDLTPAADLFSLGCILFECLTGQSPFIADHLAAVLVRILFEDPPPLETLWPGAPPALSALLTRLLAKYPEQRLANAVELRRELLGLKDLLESTSSVPQSEPRMKGRRLGDQEQGLFSIVLATAGDEDAEIGLTQPESVEHFSPADRQVLMQALASTGGSPEFLVNGMLVVTVSPLGSAQDQATIAARAALLIRDHWPEAIVSMATGRGVLRGRSAVGEVAEVAAQAWKRRSYLPSERPISGVLVDPLSSKLLEGRFAQASLPDGALLLYEEREPDASRRLLGKPTPCVGRDAELNYLDIQLASCIDESQAHAVLVTAPPGIGKSRLRHELLRRVEKRDSAVTVLACRADMNGSRLPYGILRAAIHKLCSIDRNDALPVQQECLSQRIAKHLNPAIAERVVPFIGELCGIPFSDQARPMLHSARQNAKIMKDCLRRALLDFFAAECAAAPVLLVLDDLQWSDELTVSLIDELLLESANTPLLVLALARPEVRETFPKLWQGKHVREIPLRNLSRRACERLIVQVLGKEVSADVVARAIEHSAGNALFLEENIRAIAEGRACEEVDTVLAMLQARIGRLESSVRRTLRAAAVFGATFWRSGVAALLDMPASAPELDASLSVLVDVEFVLPEAQSQLANQVQYSFRHALVRSAAYSLLTEADLITGHRLAGEFLESAGESDAAVVADHFERAGERLRAARSYYLASQTCYRQGDFDRSLAHATRGLACEPAGELRGELCSLKSTSHGARLEFDRIGESADIALGLLRMGSLGWCRALAPAVVSAFVRQDRSRTAELVSLWLAAEPDADAHAEFLFAYQGMFAALAISAPMSMLEAISQRLGVVIAQRVDADPTLRRYLCLNRSATATFRRPGPWTLVCEYQQAIALSDTVGDARMSFALRTGFIEWGWIELGDHEGAERRLTALAPAMEKTQEKNSVGIWKYLLARALCLSSHAADWDRAEQLMSPLLEPQSGFGLFGILAQGILARLALLRGAPSDAETRARAAMQFFSAMPCWLAHVAPVQIRALLQLGRASEAVAVATQVLDSIPTLGGLGIAEVEFRLAASESFYASGDQQRADSELRETLRQIQLRVDDITDPFWKTSYLNRNPACVRAQKLAEARAFDVHLS